MKWGQDALSGVRELALSRRGWERARSAVYKYAVTPFSPSPSLAACRT